MYNEICSIHKKNQNDETQGFLHKRNNIKKACLSNKNNESQNMEMNRMENNQNE